MNHMEIIQQTEGRLQEVIKETISRGKTTTNIGDLNIYFYEEYVKIGLDILKKIYESMEEEIFKNKARKKKYDVVKKDERTVLTSMGNVTYNRRLYRDKKTKKYKYLFDEKVSILKSELLTDDAKARAVEEASGTSYRKGGMNVSISDKVSKMTVKNLIKKIVIPEKDYVVLKKKEVEYLYIDADEDHIALQHEDIDSEINKLIYVYEGVKPEAPKSKRNKLINAHYFGGICKRTIDNTALWEQVRMYIEENYKTKGIKKIYLGGDGGMWIKEGKELFNNVEFVMDEFHIKKYAYKITSHLKDTQDEAIEELSNIFKKKDKEELYKYINKLYDYAKEEKEKKKIEECEKYFINNFDSIALRLEHGEHIVGCSAEGHVSHILASRMSSRPMGWTIEGANKITKLRLYKANGNSIYELIKANTEANKKVTLKKEEDNEVYSASFVMRDEKKKEKKGAKYIEQCQAELTPLGKEMLAIHNIK